MRNRGAITSTLMVSAIALITFLLRLRLSFSIDEPLGVDGYYYAVQMRQLLASGQLYYPAAPFAFWLLAPFAAFFGPIAGVKVGAAFYSSLAAYPAAFVARCATQRIDSAVIAALVTGAAVSASILATEFVKQSVGVTMALCCVAALIALTRQFTRWRVAITLLLLAASFLTHATSGALALILGIPIILNDLRSHISKRAWWMLLISTAVTALMALGYAFQRNQLLRELFTNDPHWIGVDPAWQYEAVASAVALMAGALIVIRTRDRHGVMRNALPIIVGAIALTILMNFPWLNAGDVYGLAPRLLLLGFVPLALLLPVAIAATGRAAQLLTYTVGSALVVMLFQAPAINDRVRLIARPDVAPALAGLAPSLPPDALIITQAHSEAFQVKWFTGHEATSRPPRRIDPQRTFRLLVASAFPRKAHRAFLAFEKKSGAIGVIHPLPHRYESILVVPENVWRSFVSQSTPEIRALVEPWPDQIGTARLKRAQSTTSNKAR